MEKRGQITYFIIIGIVLLFSVGFVIYVAGIRSEIGLFPAQESEIQLYIGTCLERIAEDAITAIGATGGYLEVPKQISLNERAYFSFAPRTEPKIPLWYYREEQRVPSKEFIAGQISNYTLANIDSCLNNFAPFRDRYTLQLTGNASIETTIGDNSVDVKFFYPLQTEEKRTALITRLEFVSRQINVKLGKMHDMAVDILKSEINQMFFENLTMEVLAAGTDVPFTGMDFTCAPKTWRKSNVMNFARNAVSSNIRKITVEGNSVRLFNQGSAYERNHFVFSLDKQYRDITAGFQYPDTSRFEMHVSPNDREFMVSNVGKPQNVLLSFLPICINAYHFTYDVEYPVLTTLLDSSAFDKEGFVFNFAFPVTVHNNKGTKKEFSVNTFESGSLLYSFCSNVNPFDVSIKVKDAFGYEDLYKANVEYKCVKYSCPLGETDAKSGFYQITARLPSACTSGLLRASKEGYIEGQAVYDGSNYAEIFLTPLKKIGVNIVVHNSNQISIENNVQGGESAFIFLRTRTGPKLEQVYGEESAKEIQMISGDAVYEIEAMLVQDDKRIVGGYIGTWNVSYADIADATSVTFHLVKKMPLAVTDEEQEATAEYLFSDTTYQEQLKPTFEYE